jgi:hypothetical protein
MYHKAAFATTAPRGTTAFKITVKSKSGPITWYHPLLKSVYTPIENTFLRTAFLLSTKLQLTIKMIIVVLKNVMKKMNSITNVPYKERVYIYSLFTIIITRPLIR